MSHKKDKPPGLHQAATNEADGNPASCYHYTPQRELCQILDLADEVLAQANIFREIYLATGDPQSWELAEACLADRELLLNEVKRP